MIGKNQDKTICVLLGDGDVSIGTGVAYVKEEPKKVISFAQINGKLELGSPVPDELLNGIACAIIFQTNDDIKRVIKRLNGLLEDKHD